MPAVDICPNHIAACEVNKLHEKPLNAIYFLLSHLWSLVACTQNAILIIHHRHSFRGNLANVCGYMSIFLILSMLQPVNKKKACVLS